MIIRWYVIKALLNCVLSFSLSLPTAAHAVEGGKSLYLLGKRGPLAGLIPKPGWYFTNDIYYYNAGRDGLLPISGSLDNNIKADALMNLAQITWVTDTFLNGGRLALGGLIPYGNIKVNADTALQTPTGFQKGASRSDEVTDFGDPVLAASLGLRGGRQRHRRSHGRLLQRDSCFDWSGRELHRS